MSFEELQSLKDQKKQHEENLKGEGTVIQAEKDLVELQVKIEKLLKNLATLNVEKERLAAIASGRPGIENSKILLVEVNEKIAELEQVLKSQTS